jgi:addiction module RelE/StbE family toxin
MKLIWSPLSKRNLAAIFQHLLHENPRAAVRVLELIESKVEGLGDHPAMGRPGRIAGTRELVIVGAPYISAYRLMDGPPRIEIAAIQHGARRWPNER